METKDQQDVVDGRFLQVCDIPEESTRHRAEPHHAASRAYSKRMPTQVTEICIELKRLPLRLFGRTCDTLTPNVLRLTIQPDEKISLGFGVKYPYSNNQIYYVNMVFSYSDTFRSSSVIPTKGCSLIILKGDLTLFVREDEIEAMWKVVDPIVKNRESRTPPDFPNYPAGTWGPSPANQLLKREGRNWNTV